MEGRKGRDNLMGEEGKIQKGRGGEGGVRRLRAIL